MQSTGTSATWRIKSYLAEGASTAAFMIALLGLAILLFHPGWLPATTVPNVRARLFALGLVLGLGIWGLSRTPLGKMSGPQLDPVFTLALWRLDRMSWRDCIGFCAAQFAGAAAGTGLSRLAFGPILAVFHYGALAPHPTLPEWLAFAAEGGATLVFVFGLMYCVAVPRLNAYTMRMFILLLPILVCIDGPISGSGMNPARWFGSALFANQWSHWEIYLIAPIAGSLLALGLVRLLAKPEPAAVEPARFADAA